MATIGTLQRLSAASLSKLILAEQAAAASDRTIAIIDVRDDDHIGGHIKGSRHVPSQTLDVMLPTLVRQLQDKRTVVFHCALSQQRGPGAALRYLRERERMFPAGKGKGTASSSSSSSSAKEEDGEGESQQQQQQQQQEVFVLDQGFVGWQAAYGEDERLTEGFRKEIWREDMYS